MKNLLFCFLFVLIGCNDFQKAVPTPKETTTSVIKPFLQKLKMDDAPLICSEWQCSAVYGFSGECAEYKFKCLVHSNGKIYQLTCPNGADKFYCDIDWAK